MNMFQKVLSFPILIVLIFACVMPSFAGLGTVISSQDVTMGTWGTHTIIHQEEAIGIITVDSLSVGPGEYLEIRQPRDEAALTVVRIQGSSVSAIENVITATGTIILINEHGFDFQSGSFVEAGSLLVSTQPIHDNEFLNPNGTIETLSDNTSAGIINSQGRMNIGRDPYGLANLALIGTSVQHGGWIELSKDGRATLAAANVDEIPFLSGGSAIVGNPLTTAALGTTKQLSVTGRIHIWFGGNLDLIANVDATLAASLSHAAHFTGITYVYNTHSANGKISLDGGNYGITEVGNFARLDAVHTNSAGIDLLGGHVILTGQAQFNARGHITGGDITIESRGKFPSDIGSGVTFDIVGETGADGDVMIIN